MEKLSGMIQAGEADSAGDRVGELLGGGVSPTQGFF